MAGLLLLTVPVHAQGDIDRLLAQFDRPAAVKKLPPKSDDDPTGQITCTFYRDLMVREAGTDTPAPTDATLLPFPAGQTRPTCDASHHTGELTLKTAGFSFIGRKSQFLVFSATDPNGAVPFMVIDAGSGRTIFEDGTAADVGVQSVAISKGALHLRYRRGINAACSLMQNAENCWSQLINEGKIPRAMEHAAPSPKACAASYKSQKAPADDPSVVTYDVDAIIDAAGQAQVQPHGAVRCEPVP